MSILASRGVELAAGPDIRSLWETAGSDKYHPTDNRDGFVNIGTAENYVMLPEIADYVSKHPPMLLPQDFSYGEGPWWTKRMREAMASHLKQSLKPVDEIEARDVLLANGVTALCERRRSRRRYLDGAAAISSLCSGLWNESQG